MSSVSICEVDSWRPPRPVERGRRSDALLGSEGGVPFEVLDRLVIESGRVATSDQGERCPQPRVEVLDGV